MKTHLFAKWREIPLLLIWKIHADKVVVTTHFPFINKHGSYFIKLYQHRSYVIALENAKNSDGMFVDENRKGMSFRTSNNMLLLGGGGHRTGKKVVTGRNFAPLQRKSILTRLRNYLGLHKTV